MADLPEVKPGDLITAEQINSLIKALNALAKQANNGTVIVPLLIGRTISDTRALVALPGTQLALGVIIDANGLQLDPLDSKVQSRVLIGQEPSPGASVLPGTTLTLIAAGVPGGAVTQVPAVKISGVDKQSVAVDDTLGISGTNFANPLSNNSITFNNTPGLLMLNQSTANLLQVKVPANIPGAPTQPGQQPLAGVVVKVAAGQTSSDSVVVTILPPVSNKPSITKIEPLNGQVTGANITITGTNFGADINQVKVFVAPQGALAGGDRAVVTTPFNATTITATLPQTVTGLTPGNAMGFNIRVEITGQPPVTALNLYTIAAP